jgi:hypothetical protein
MTANAVGTTQLVVPEILAPAELSRIELYLVIDRVEFPAPITNLLRGLARSTATVFPMRTSGVVPGPISLRTKGAVVQHLRDRLRGTLASLPSLFWRFSIASKARST